MCVRLPERRYIFNNFVAHTDGKTTFWGWIKSEGGVGNISVRGIFGSLQIGMGPRSSPSACSETLKSNVLDRRRWIDDKYNLDLTYIVDDVIAMSYPAEGISVAWRNPYEQVQYLGACRRRTPTTRCRSDGSPKTYLTDTCLRPSTRHSPRRLPSVCAEQLPNVDHVIAMGYPAREYRWYSAFRTNRC